MVIFSTEEISPSNSLNGAEGQTPDFWGDELKIKTPSKNCRFYSEDEESLKQRIGGGIGRLEYYNGSKFEDRSYC